MMGAASHRKVVVLTEKERHFLAAAALRADATPKELSAELGLREHAVRYIRDSLLEREIIRPVYHINHFRLGYNDFGVYLSRGSESTASRRRFEALIERHPAVFWLARTSGAYQYAMSFVTHKPYELGSLLSLARPAEAGGHFEKSLGLRLDWTILAPTYLIGSSRRRHSISVSADTEVKPLDDTDTKLLRILSAHPAKPVADWARTAAMSSSSVSYRIEQLRKQGVIAAQRYLINLAKLGFNGHRLLLIDRGLSAQQRDDFSSLCLKHPNVVAFLSCTGNWDYELRLEAEHPGELEEFCQLLYDTFGNAIGSIKTMQQVEVFKHVAFPA